MKNIAKIIDVLNIVYPNGIKKDQYGKALALAADIDDAGTVGAVDQAPASKKGNKGKKLPARKINLDNPLIAPMYEALSAEPISANDLSIKLGAVPQAVGRAVVDLQAAHPDVVVQEKGGKRYLSKSETTEAPAQAEAQAEPAAETPAPKKAKKPAAETPAPKKAKKPAAVTAEA